MNFLQLTVILISLLTSNQMLYAQNDVDCKSFRTGNYYNIAPGDSLANTEIIRTAKYQLERYFKYGAECRFKIIWIDECTYELIFDSGNNECLKVVDPNIKVRVNIIETTESSHFVEGWLVGSENKIQSQLIKKSAYKYGVEKNN